jgi:hypothetical protein
MLILILLALTVVQQTPKTPSETPLEPPFLFSTKGKLECFTAAKHANATPTALVLEVGRIRPRSVQAKTEVLKDGSLRGYWERFEPFTTLIIRVSFSDGTERFLGPIVYSNSNDVFHPEQVEKRGWKKGMASVALSPKRGMLSATVGT